jgi:predicted kinase
MLELIFLKGLPGSGKSTWTENFLYNTAAPNTYKRINKDLLRTMLDCNIYSSKSEKFIIKTRDELILLALANGFNVIVDDTNLNPVHEQHIRLLVKNIENLKFTVKFFDTDINECITNDLKRTNSVGSKVIKDMYNKWLKPAPVAVKYNNELPDCIIVDIDGTVALKTPARSPFDWDKVDGDLPNTNIINFINNYLEANTIPLIFVSGRDSICKDTTERWLSCFFKKYKLFMRPENDYRKDTIIKREIYEKEILNKFNVLFVLDDRDCVVEQWRNMGLTCLQVAEGDF